jgi:hypothetical protein
MSNKVLTRPFNALWKLICNFYWRIRTCRIKKLSLKVIKGDFPQNLKYIHTNRDIKTIVVESLPGKRMILIQDRPFCLYFPYTYFIMTYRDSISPKGKCYVLMNFWIGFSPCKIMSTDGFIGRLPLSNYSGSFSFCLGDGSPTFGPYETVRELAETCINSFWKTSFEMSFVSTRIDDWLFRTKNNTINARNLVCFDRSTAIYEVCGVKAHEQFFEYQAEEAEATKPAATRPSRNGSNRRKRKKSSRRKA